MNWVGTKHYFPNLKCLRNVLEILNLENKVFLKSISFENRPRSLNVGTTVGISDNMVMLFVKLIYEMTN